MGGKWLFFLVSFLMANIGCATSLPDIEKNGVSHTFIYSPNAARKSQMLRRGKTESIPPGGRLIEAVKDRYFDVVLLNLKEKGVREKDGPDALLYAIQQRDEAMVAFLLAAGVSPDIPAANAWYPMGEAARTGNMRVMCMLLDYGVDVNKANARVGNVRMAVSAAHIDAVVLLMAMGYKPSVGEISNSILVAKRLGLNGLLDSALQINASSSLLESLCQYQ